jgi:hypothetical protein
MLLQRAQLCYTVPRNEMSSFMLCPPYRAATVAASQAAVGNNTLENVATAQESYISPPVAMYLQMTHLARQRQRALLSNHGHIAGVSHLDRYEPADMTPIPLSRTRVDHGNVSDHDHMAGNGTSDSSHWYQVAANLSPQTAHTGTLSELPACLSMASDRQRLSRIQVWLRLQIEVFGASTMDVDEHVRGRNKPVRLGQVGLRCRHCAHVSAVNRGQGAVYFPSSTMGLYQAAQNMYAKHFNGSCRHLPTTTRAQFASLITTPTTTTKGSTISGAGRKYWASTAQSFGLVDTVQGIFHIHDAPPGAVLVAIDREAASVSRVARP